MAPTDTAIDDKPKPAAASRRARPFAAWFVGVPVASRWFGTLALLGILVVLLITFLSQRSAGQMIERVLGLDRRIASIAGLQADASTYVEQVGAVLLVGRDQLDALGSARVKMERDFANLMQVTRAEVTALSNMNEVEKELPRVETGRRMLELYHSIDLSANDALAFQRSGQQQDAVDEYQRNVQFRVANELQPLLQTDLEDAVEETQQLSASLSSSRWIALWSALAVALLGFAAAILAVWRWRVAVQVSRSSAGDTSVGGAAERDSQLREMRERLGDIDRRRAQFLADVGHELRTPLTVLRGEADVALRGPDEAEPLRQSLERIRGQSAELARLLDDLIAFARTDVEAQPDILTDIAVGEVVRAAAGEAELLALPREVTIGMTLADGGCHVTADFRRLKQALMIGLDNAIKHSAPGSAVEVATGRGDGGVSIRVLDRGPGIAAEDQPHVFERFYRGHGEMDTLADGLGIGLAIAREIVERHAGSISLRNREAGGAILEITLPMGTEAIR